MSKCFLADISDIITGPFGSQLHESDYVAVGIPAIMPQNIGNRTLNYEGIARITETDANRLSRYLVRENDIVYARRGDVEKHAFITAKDERAICGTGCLRVRITAPNVYPAFISHYLNRPETKRWISQHAVGSNMLNLNTDILGAVPIDLPTYSIQKTVADVLTSIDLKIDLNKCICKELDGLAKTLYDYWFTQFDFPNDEGKPYHSSNGEMKWNDQLKQKIPKEWAVRTIDSLMWIDNNSIDPRKFGVKIMEHYSIPAFDDGRYPAFEPSSAIESAKYAVDSECILTSKLNPQFKRLWDPYCETPNAICSTEFIVYRPREDWTRPYCYAVLNSDAFYAYMATRATASTGSRKRIQPEVSAAFPIAIPDEQTMRSFVAVYEPIMKQIKNLHKENHELATLRDWLLPMLMNGQAVVE